MAKKDPPKADPPKKVPATKEDRLAGIETPDQMAGLVEVLALLAGRLQGLQGIDLKKHIGELKTQVQSVVDQVEQQQQTDAARDQAAIEVEKLVDSVVATGSSAGRALEAQRGPILDAFRAADLHKAAEGLHLIAEWLSHPSDDTRKKVETLVDELQRTMGTVIGYDPAREDAARREEIRAGVKDSLDKIFKAPRPAFDPKVTKPK